MFGVVHDNGCGMGGSPTDGSKMDHKALSSKRRAAMYDDVDAGYHTNRQISMQPFEATLRKKYKDV